MNRNILIVLSLIASIITIFVFLTGKSSIKEFDTSSPNTINEEKVISLKISNGIGLFKDKLFLIQNGDEELLFAEWKISEASLSPNNMKVASIIKISDWVHDYVKVANIDGSFPQSFTIKTGWRGLHTKNLYWITNNKFRIYVEDRNDLFGEPFGIDNFNLNSPGVFELTLNEYNALSNITRID